MIQDLDQLVRSSTQTQCGTDGNIWLDSGTKTFRLRPYGDLVYQDGLDGQALYSYFKDQWKTDNTLIKHPFPAFMIDADAGKLIFGFDGALYNGWKPEDDETRNFLRNVGWDEYDGSGVLNRRYHGVVTIGSVGSTDQLYYQREVGNGDLNDFTFRREFTWALKVNKSLINN